MGKKRKSAFSVPPRSASSSSPKGFFDAVVKEKTRKLSHGVVVKGGRQVKGSVISQIVADGFNPKEAGPFRSKDRILLVGEGDFSFAATLCTLIGGTRLVATCLDTKPQLMAKYLENARENLAAIRLSDAKFLFEIDATNAEDLQKCTKAGDFTAFDTVAFNFPHLGGATEKDVKSNQNLIRGFLEAAKSVITERNGRIIVALRTTKFYTSWDILGLASEASLHLERQVPFRKSDFPGYEEARTNPAFRKAAEVDQASFFVLKQFP